MNLHVSLSPLLYALAMDIERLTRGDMPPGEIVNFLIKHASDVGASDIHIDRVASGVSIRLRVDGVLRLFAILPESVYGGIVICIKVIARLRTDIHHSPQDGRITLDFDGCRYNFRVSTIPSHYGESFVLRILKNDGLPMSLSGLGFDLHHEDEILRALRAKKGMIVVTGPTGSGKTSTLYNLINLCDRDRELIITLEDPIEYSLENVRQIPIRDRYGMSFANALRSVLRQDPDTIMLGEIRDTETARIAVQASLTGHRLFTTLHTDRAINAIARLMDMGIDQHMIVSTLSMIIAQRLVRRTCLKCLGNKCTECSMTGYKGRVLIAEIISIDDDIKEILLKSKSLLDVDRYIKSKGFVSLHSSAKEKVQKGITDVNEIKRVFDYEI